MCTQLGETDKLLIRGFGVRVPGGAQDHQGPDLVDVTGGASQTWSAFLRSQAEAILAADFFETATLSGKRMYVLTVIEHVTRHVRILGATAHRR